MRERWVVSSQSLVLSIAVGRVATDDDEQPEVQVVATGHTNGHVMLRAYDPNTDEEDDEPLPVCLGGRGESGGAVRSLAMDGNILVAGSENGAVRLLRVTHSFGRVQPVSCTALATLVCDGEVEAVCLVCMVATAKRLGAGVSGIGGACGGLRVWSISTSLLLSDDDDHDAGEGGGDDDEHERERTGRTGCEGLLDESPETTALGVGDVYALALRSDGRQLLAGGADGGVWLWQWEPDASGTGPALIWKERRGGAVQSVSLTFAGLVVAASDHKPPGEAAAGTAALLLRTSVDGCSWEVELPNSRSPYCKDMLCDGGVQQQQQQAPPTPTPTQLPTLGQGMWSGRWTAPVTSTSCPVCSTAFPVVLATSLVDELDGTTSLLFGGYGRQIERWEAVFGGPDGDVTP